MAKSLKTNWHSNESNGIDLTSKRVVFKKSKVSITSSTAVKNLGSEDVTLIVDNQKLCAHKSVLASNSDYFDKMFTSSFKEKDKEKIEINVTDISYEALSSLVEFCYSSTLVIAEHNVQDLLIGSNIFLLEDVREACADYLKSMIDAENVINMKHFANSLSLNDLYSLCMNYMVHNFRLVANLQEFVTLTYDEVLSLIKNDDLFAREDMVYDVVMEWVRYDSAVRHKYVPDLLWFVRLPLVLNTYQGGNNVRVFQGAKVNGLCSFRMEYRKPFRKGILMLSNYPINSSPEWYDASVDQWHNCICINCPCKHFQIVLSPPEYLCTCTLLDDGRLFAAGGYKYSRGMQSVNIFDVKTKKWNPLPYMHLERIKPFILQMGSKIFVIGGCIAEHTSYYNTIEFYDLERSEWIIVDCPITGTKMCRNYTLAASVNGLIYIFGLNGAGYYNPLKNTWQNISPLPERKLGAAICTLNSSIYVIGGHTKEQYFKTVWAYCTETKVWVAVADMNSPRSNSGVVVMNGYIYVFGGKSDNKTYLNTFEVYSPHDNEWTTSNALMNMGRCNIDVIVVEKSCDLFKKVLEDETHNIIY